MSRLKAAIVGATGIVGQQFILALQDHPWFTIAALAGSRRSAGRSYGDALRSTPGGAVQWYADGAPDDGIFDVPVEDAAALEAERFDVIFSAVESDAARELEPRYARSTPVISTASAFRYEDDVPVLLPGVNDDHAGLIDCQRKSRGWRGFIAPNPNCTTVGLAITLAPLARCFGLEAVVMTSLQAVSGAGRHGGVLGLDIIDNVIPYIAGEEEKVRRETCKILGRYGPAGLQPAAIRMSATCTRVPVLEGHTESVLALTTRTAALDEARDAFDHFGTELARMGLPSAPRRLIAVHDDPFRPQPRLDRSLDDGMATSVGRLRTDSAFENGLQYVLLSHNTRMGAANGTVLTAELLAHGGYIGGGGNGRRTAC